MENMIVEVLVHGIFTYMYICKLKNTNIGYIGITNALYFTTI